MKKKIPFILLGLMLTLVMVIIAPTVALADSSGWKNAIGYNDNNSVGSPGNAYVSNNTYANFDSHADSVHYTFGNNIVPSTAIIQGIEVRLEARRSTVGGRKFEVTLLDNGTGRGEKATGRLTTSDKNYTLGGTSDTWGYGGWTADKINNHLEVKVRSRWGTFNAYLDHVQLRVTYTLPTTTTTVASSDSSSTYGQTVTFTANVSPSAATGTVKFYADGSLIGSNAVSGGSASISTSTLPAGNHTIRAEYSGSSLYQESSGTCSQTVNKADATIVVHGANVTYDGAAHGATGTATGADGSNLISLLDLGSSFSNVPGGTAHWSFAGDANHNSASGSVAINISKADASIVVTGADVTYDGTAHGASGTATSADGITDLSTLLHLGGSFTNVPGGTANWTFDGDSNHNADSGSVAIKISKADATIVVTGANVTYDGTAHGASGTATSADGITDLSTLLHLGSSFTNVPGGTANWTFDGDSNHNADSGSVAINISKADATIVVTGANVTYDGTAHGASGTATSADGITDLSTLLHLGSSFTNVPGGTANWTFDGDSNHNADSGSVAININKADATINVQGVTVTYDGAAHGATGTAVGADGSDMTPLLDLGLSFTDAPGGTANWSFAGDANHKSASGSVQIVINKADATIDVSGVTVTYDGTAHGATGTATGIDGSDLTSLLNFGEAFTNVPGGTANWSFAGDTNHSPANGSVAIVINKADATIDVSGVTVTYDGTAHGATGTATGIDGSDLTSLLNFGEAFTNVPGGTANWSFTGNNNHKSASGSVDIVINKADANINVVGTTVTYDGYAHGAIGTATGADGSDLGTLLDLGASFTNVPGGTANWSFTGNNNHKSASGSVAIVINKADATIDVSGATVTYDGAAHGATGTATGADGSDLTGLLDLGASFTNVPGGTAYWSFAGDVNHNAASGSVAIVISKADATIDVSGETVTYDGVAHGATGTATGADGSDLSGLLDLGASFTNVPGGTANWSFAGDANHNAASGSVDIVINKADATIDVSGATVTYDGAAHGATGTATGADGSDLSGLLDLGSSFTNVPGGTANWSFAGDANHNAASGSVDIVINKADATIDVSGATVTYDGAAHGATGTATGADGSDLTGLLDLGASFTNVPGGTANWSFAGDANHNAASGSVDIVINKADATIDVSGATVTYDGAAHGATGTATGADGSDLTGLLDLGASFTNVPGGTANWSFAGDANHNAASGSVDIDINKADATIVVQSHVKTYGDADPALTATVTGQLNGETLDYTLNRVSGENVGTYAITAVLGATPVNTNYEIIVSPNILTINPKAATIIVEDHSKRIGSNDPTLTATVTGTVNGEVLDYTLSRTAGETLGSYTIAATVSGAAVNGNYDIAVVDGTLTIVYIADTATPTPTVSATPTPTVTPTATPTTTVIVDPDVPAGGSSGSGLSPWILLLFIGTGLLALLLLILFLRRRREDEEQI